MRQSHTVAHGVLLAASLVWLFPLAWSVFVSFRPYADTATRGYVALPGTLTIDNYIRAWNEADLGGHFINSAIIVVPTVVVVLLLGSAIGFVSTQMRVRFAVPLLLVFLAGSLLPPEIVALPLVRLFLPLGLYDSLVGVIAVHIAFQLGFCSFVLAAFMRGLPAEMFEAARLEGASIARIVWTMAMPLTRPALAALATLEVVWIYNDFLWALVLIQTGSRRPVTTALSNLSGEFFTDYNVVAAGAILVALPTLAVFLIARRHLTRGLALGSVDG